MEFNFLTTATLSLLPIVAILEKLEGVWSTESGIEQKGELEVGKKKIQRIYPVDIRRC